MSDKERPATVEGDGDGWRVLSLRGELDLATVDDLRSLLAGLAARDHPGRMVIDLSDTELIDVVGARPPVEWKQLLDGGCTVVLRDPRPIVRKVLEMVGLDGPCIIDDRPSQHRQD